MDCCGSDRSFASFEGRLLFLSFIEQQNIAEQLLGTNIFDIYQLRLRGLLGRTGSSGDWLGSPSSWLARGHFALSDGLIIMQTILALRILYIGLSENQFI